MVAKHVSQLKPGEILLEDVLTPLGNVLFYKERCMTQRDIDILHAFMLDSVEVISEQNTGEDKAKENPTIQKGAVKAAPVHSFLMHYEKMMDVMRSVHNTVMINQPIPLMDIRNQLSHLFEFIGDYNIIRFIPPNFHENEYSLHKSIVTSLTSFVLAKSIGFPEKDRMPVALAGLLMDIGNLKVDPNLLNKEGKLTAAEMDEVRKHTIYGYQILQNQRAINEGVRLTALQHHERIDGSGYPKNIDAIHIHPYAKVAAIADIYHAMTLNKVYRKAVSPYLVMEQIQSDAFGKLDPAYVRTFIESATKFNIGTRVKLNDGRIGEIVFYERDYPTRPWVSINQTIVNLTTERSYHIIEVIQ